MLGQIETLTNKAKINNLFWKIFLWFWLTILLALFALIATVRFTSVRHFEAPAFINGTMKIYAGDAARVFEKEGLDGLTQYFAEIQEQTQLKVAVLDENENQLNTFTEIIPDDLKKMSFGNDNLNKTLVVEVNTGLYSIHRTNLNQGKTLILYTRIFQSPFDGLSFSFSSYSLRIFVVFLIAGLFCYWLARYFASPIAKIRNATQQLADGNLAVRVSPIIGKRRDELAEMGRDFDQMAERIESLMSAQWRLLRDISHELRSPLARLNIGLALARKKANPETTQALDRIEQEATQMNEMVNQLLELDRWEFATEEQSNEEINLAEMLVEIVLDADFEARNQNRRVLLTELENCTIKGIPSLVRSAIENVVRNGLRHTDEATTVEIQMKREQKNGTKYALIAVSDQGSGVPEASLREIFQPFFRVDEARDREQGGTGLGLAITERAVRLHQGTVTARNDVEKGFIVEIRIPLTS